MYAQPQPRVAAVQNHGVNSSPTHAGSASIPRWRLRGRGLSWQVQNARVVAVVGRSVGLSIVGLGPPRVPPTREVDPCTMNHPPRWSSTTRRSRTGSDWLWSVSVDPARSAAVPKRCSARVFGRASVTERPPARDGPHSSVPPVRHPLERRGGRRAGAN